MALYRLPTWQRFVDLNGTRYTAVGDGLFVITDEADIAAAINMGAMPDASEDPLIPDNITDAVVTLDSAQGSGIMVAGSPATYGWRDITSDVTVRGVAGGTTPSWNTYRDGIRQYQFSVNDECWHVFHMPHDWVPGTDVYIHAHWSHADASVSSGGVSWSFEVTWAKGFNQSAFAAPVTATATQTASTTQYKHMVAEVQLSATSPSGSQVDTDGLEVDGLFLVRTYLSANTMNGTPEPFLHTVDLHYQTTNIGTLNKAPDFYA